MKAALPLGSSCLTCVLSCCILSTVLLHVFNRRVLRRVPRRRVVGKNTTVLINRAMRDMSCFEFVSLMCDAPNCCRGTTRLSHSRSPRLGAVGSRHFVLPGPFKERLKACVYAALSSEDQLLGKTGSVNMDLLEARIPASAVYQARIAVMMPSQPPIWIQTAP
jgi:hypothetical protein